MRSTPRNFYIRPLCINSRRAPLPARPGDASASWGGPLPRVRPSCCYQRFRTDSWLRLHPTVAVGAWSVARRAVPEEPAGQGGGDDEDAAEVGDRQQRLVAD